MDPLAQLVGDSPGLAAVREQVKRLLQRQSDARRMPPILIQGETGTGKGLLARAMHAASARARGPFIDVNCAAIPETLLEAEMFGVERGAFTDARQAKPGLLQLANGGTIFLDEIALLPETLQAKLLKAIEERAVRRLGGTKLESVDVWILTATNEDLAAAARARRFREDLYHRLAVITLSLPPLRDRGDDVVRLADHFLARACADYGLAEKTLTPAARAALARYSWPGNIRELSNAMERVALLSQETTVGPEALDLREERVAEAPAAYQATAAQPLEAAVADVEREHVLRALEATGGNVTRAAARLGISRNTMRYRMEKYGLGAGVPVAPVRRDARAQPVAPSAAAAQPVPAPVAPSVEAGRRERRRLAFLRAALTVTGRPEATSRARAVLDLLRDKVVTFGGRIEELNASGVVAVFGLEPVEDAPVRAAHAAMAIVNGLRHIRQSDGNGAALRLAIHVDQFLVEQVAGAAAIDHEARLHAWAVLTSLGQTAEPDGIVVSEAAVPFLERRFELLPAATPHPEGGRVYRLLGRDGRKFGRSVAPFVGRQHELALLQSRLQAAARGQGQVVGISGEAGIGKSRLLYEFRRLALEGGAAYLEGHCLSYGSEIPYLPVLEILRTTCGITDGDTPELVATKVRANFEQAGMGPEDGALYLLHLLGIKDESDRVASLEPEMIKIRVCESLRQLYLRHSRRQPLVIVVEDFHWIDAASEEFFLWFIEAVPGVPILLVATYRSGYRPRWIEKSYATQVALQPLAPAESLAVVQSVIGDDQVDAAVVERIISRAEGNPFFLEELVSAVREQGLESVVLTVPETVEQVLRARIDRLPAGERELLQSAAVIGRHVPNVLLQAVADLPEDRLHAALRHLQAAEFLYETNQGGDLEYTFKHSLTHDVTYQSLGGERQRALHARIVEALERVYAGRLTQQIERLAHHAFRGEAWEKAADYLRRAGQKAAAASAHQEAVACFELALIALQHLPMGRGMMERAIDCRFDLRNSLHPLGEFGRLLDHLNEAKELAEALGDQRRLGRVFSYMVQYFRLAGDPERAIDSGRRAVAIAERLEDFSLRVAIETNLGPAYGNVGDYAKAIEILKRHVESLPSNLSREPFGLAGLPSVFCRIYLVACLAEVGQFKDGVAYGEEATRLAEAADHLYSLTFADYGLGNLYLLKGDSERARTLLERGFERCQTFNFPLMFPLLASSLGAACALSGRYPEAIRLLEQAVQQAESMARMGGQSILLTRLGEAYLLAGRVDDASQLAGRAIQYAREHQERGHEAYALRFQGDVCAHRDPPDAEAAEGHYGRALALAEELGMRPLLAHCHRGLGSLYRRTGRHAEAGRHSTAAVTLFREMEMRFWLEHAESD